MNHRELSSKLDHVHALLYRAMRRDPEGPGTEEMYRLLDDAEARLDEARTKLAESLEPRTRILSRSHRRRPVRKPQPALVIEVPLRGPDVDFNAVYDSLTAGFALLAGITTSQGRFITEVEAAVERIENAVAALEPEDDAVGAQMLDICRRDARATVSKLHQAMELVKAAMEQHSKLWS